MQKSGLYETPPRRQFKDYFCYFPIWLIYQLVHDIPSKCQPLSQRFSLLHYAILFFRVLLTFSITIELKINEAADSSRSPTE